MFKTQHVFRNMIIDKSCVTTLKHQRFQNNRVKYPTSIFLKADQRKILPFHLHDNALII